MIGASTFINPLIRIIVALVILGAIYLLFLRPILDTTEDAFNSVAPAIQQAQNVSPQIDKSIAQAQKLQRDAQHASNVQLHRANKLLDCIRRAGGDVDEIQACNSRFSP